MDKNHGQRYVEHICKNYIFNSILEIGCSNGLAVQKFRKNKKYAWGLDASDVAIRVCCNKGIVQCVYASAHKIPFKDKLFDAVFSSDVLEHLEESEANMAIYEICRVTKKYLFLLIDDKLERNTEHIDKARKEFPEVFANVANLHLTVKPFSWWETKIRNQGFNLIDHIQVYPEDEIKLAVFECSK
jgi:ubiquinone/menaquinone biosynthesis C-methylase UbiE